MLEGRLSVGFLDKNAYSKKKKLRSAIKKLVRTHDETLQARELGAKWAAIT